MDVADDKNADGASITTLLIPRPPSLIGSLACIQAVSLRAQLVMEEIPDLSSESNLIKVSCSAQGEERKTLSILELPKAVREISKAS